MWGLRIDELSVALVLQNAAMPLGGHIDELVVGLPHVAMPFDFSEGVLRFRHHRGLVRSATLSLDLQVLFERLAERTNGLVTGRAVDGAIVFSGHTEEGARFTARARVVPDPGGPSSVDFEGEPTLLLSLYDFRVYGRTDVPWSVMGGTILDALDPDWVVERSLSTARVAILHELLAWSLTDLGWKLPSMAGLRLTSAVIDDDRMELRFAGEGDGEFVTIDAAVVDAASRESFERFVQDLELKQHHGAIDRALQRGLFRDAMAELYRTIDGPLRPGYLVERLIGICAANPVLFDEGDKVCREVLLAAPGYPTALCGLASIAMGRGLLEEAAVHFERLSTALTGAAERQDAICADLTLAESLRAIDKHEARAALERILSRAPDHEEALDALLAIAGDTGNEVEALGLCKRLLFAARNTDRTRMAGLRLARYALGRNEPAEARVYLEVVLEALPGDLQALMALADVALHDGDETAAVHTLEQALRTNSTQDDAVLVKVVHALAKRALAMEPPQPERARRVLWRAVDHGAIDDAMRVVLGRLALQADALDLADRFARAIDERSPSWGDGRSLVAKVLLSRGRGSEAVSLLLDVLAGNPGHDGALETIGQAAQTPADRERCLVALTAAVPRAKAGRPHGQLNAVLGELYEATGLHWDAIEPLREAVSALAAADPRWESAARRLLHLYRRFGMWPEHQALCDVWLEARQAPEDRIPCLLAHGRVALEEQDDPTFAIPSLEELLVLAPRDAEGLTLYRDALERLGAVGERGDKLIGALRRLESIHPDDRERVQARIRLAELQLELLDAPGQARATLGRLPGWAQSEPRVALISARIAGDLAAIAGAEAAVAVEPPPGLGQRGGASLNAYERGVAAADRADLDSAARWVSTWLEDNPLHVPGLELQRLIALDARDRATAVAATDALVALTLEREARVSLMAETVSLLPVTMPQYWPVLEKLGWVPPPHLESRTRPVEPLPPVVAQVEAPSEAEAILATESVVDAELGVAPAPVDIAAQGTVHVVDSSLLEAAGIDLESSAAELEVAVSSPSPSPSPPREGVARVARVGAAKTTRRDVKVATPADGVPTAQKVQHGELTKTAVLQQEAPGTPRQTTADFPADFRHQVGASPSRAPTPSSSHPASGESPRPLAVRDNEQTAPGGLRDLLQRPVPSRRPARDTLQDWPALDELQMEPTGEPQDTFADSGPLPPAAQARLDEADAVDTGFSEAEQAVADGRREDAFRAIHTVLGLDADHVGALELFAGLLADVGGWRPLADTLGRLAELSFDAQQTLAYTLERAQVLAERLDDMEGAAASWGQYLEWQPLDDVVHEQLASYLEIEGRYEDLARLLADRGSAAADALADERDVPTASMLATRLATTSRKEALLRLHRLDDPEGALEAIQRGVDARPGDPELMEAHVRVLAALGQRQPCRDLLDELLPLLLPGPLRDELLLLRGN